MEVFVVNRNFSLFAERILPVNKLACAAAAAVLTLSFTQGEKARAAVIDFDQAQACGGSPCDNFANNSISQSYGDIASVVDISYLSAASGLNWWGVGYTPLVGVAYGQTNTSITIAALNGQSVTLNGFDMAAFVTDVGLATVVTIDDLLGNNLAVSSTTVGHPTHFGFNVTSSNGIRISWQGTNNLNVAIDNIDYTLTNVGPVPEPSTWAMMLLGFAGVGFVAYRRARKVDRLALTAA
jgi:hypothetical protein